MHRERACLAQRADSGPQLEGKAKRTIRNMLTELFKHSWPRLWPEYAALGRTERAAYQDAVLQQVDGLHKTVAAEAEGEATEEHSASARRNPRRRRRARDGAEALLPHRGAPGSRCAAPLMTTT